MHLANSFLLKMLRWKKVYFFCWDLSFRLVLWFHDGVCAVCDIFSLVGLIFFLFSLPCLAYVTNVRLSTKLNSYNPVVSFQLIQLWLWCGGVTSRPINGPVVVGRSSVRKGGLNWKKGSTTICCIPFLVTWKKGGQCCEWQNRIG